ncbi:alpha/beta hydrolase [Sphingobacterium tabacisoli]|uniref:Alpha/beta hydrolase n=1 Tax=Sphingobacterium tabacisoli TaxID=2044855 RepID=A0ABW5L8J4_9SPHI|nr:alpha/beta hydrolase-fold protein [Sphingobacterium tabacisoli]
MSKKMHKIYVHIDNNCSSFIGEALYLVGTFNNWSPDHLYVGEIPEKGKSITVVLPEVKEGDLELKMSRGSWESLSTSGGGRLEGAHMTTVSADSEVFLTIESWRDLFPKSTASKQVHVLAEDFYFPKLNVYKKVWIYLPQNYLKDDRHYPVIYMHDGQHLFDEATSTGRAGPIEWMVDETIDGAITPSIVVAVAHDQDYEVRKEEYMVHAGEELSTAKGWWYLDDLVHRLKPYVDRQYRTLMDPLNTALVGSSLGGLVSIYAGLKYPQVFGVIGAFSPSIWMDEENLYAYASKELFSGEDKYRGQELYFYVGGREIKRRVGANEVNMGEDLARYHIWLEQHYKGKLSLAINSEGKHGAIYWQSAFRRFYTHWENKINSFKHKNIQYECK